MLKVGDKAPDFTLLGSNGNEIALQDFRGKQVVLYFYPKDDTPGCTVEACSLRDYYTQILQKGAVVLGVSPDDTASHVRFVDKYSLPFYLLSDPEHKAAADYGAWGEKKRSGEAYEGILRSTFIIDKDGRISKVFPDVNPEGHGEAILEAL